MEEQNTEVLDPGQQSQPEAPQQGYVPNPEQSPAPLPKKRHSKMVILLILIVLLGICGSAWFLLFKRDDSKTAKISNFEECIAAGNPVQQSFPERCTTKEGTTFNGPGTENINKNGVGNKETPQLAETQPPPEDVKYLAVEGWGIKIKTSDAEKVKVTVSNRSGEIDGDKFIGSMTPEFKPNTTTDKDCNPGVTLYRATADGEVSGRLKVGKYYYWAQGSPSRCDNATDSALQMRFLGSFLDIEQL